MPVQMVELIKGFLFNPVESFRKARETSLAEAYQYYVILLLFFSILFGVVMYLELNPVIPILTAIPGMADLGGIVNAILAQLSILAIYVLFFIGLFSIFISGLYYHVFVTLLGGEEGLVQTFKTVMYANTPALLIGWIPMIGIIGAIWSIVLFIIGMREMQKVSLVSAILIILVPTILIIGMVFIASMLMMTIIGLFAAIAA